MIRRIVLQALLTLPTLADAQTISGTRDSLCTIKETMYFSCKIDHEESFVSVCARGNTSPQSGYVQYRYGTKGKVVFTYPASRLPPGTLFSIQAINHFRDGIGKHIAFNNHEYTYIVSTAVQPAEVGVFRRGTLIATKSCAFSGSFDDINNKADKGIQQGKQSHLDRFDGS